MDPGRKRRVRLMVALGAGVALAVALVYTSFSASSEARSPSQLLAGAGADPGKSYQLTGKVVDGSIKKTGTSYAFRVRDRDGSVSVPIAYTGSVADTFRGGARGDRDRQARGRHVRRREGLADHEVPVEVPRARNAEVLSGGGVEVTGMVLVARLEDLEAAKEARYREIRRLDALGAAR
jgi:cytochrome c-type biogenesis protein CcmE